MKRTQWYVVGPTGRVERFRSRGASRAYQRAHGGTKAGYTSGEYHLRVAPKVRRGIPRSVARGHAKGNAVVIPKHRTRSGATVRKQWTIGTEGGEEMSLDRLRRRLVAFQLANPDLKVVSVAIHGVPYRDRASQPRWAGGVVSIEALDELVTKAEEAGMTEARDVAFFNRPLWDHIDEIALARPGPE